MFDDAIDEDEELWSKGSHSLHGVGGERGTFELGEVCIFGSLGILHCLEANARAMGVFEVGLCGGF